MEQITQMTLPGGGVEFFKDLKRKFFLARPHGVINPPMLATDLKLARNFSKEIQGPWTYITNTEHVRLVNPYNLRYLKEVKKIKHLKRIVIFAPGFFNRLLIRASGVLVQPDMIIKDKAEFEKFLDHVK